ncbi:MAG: hypothetical protein ACOYT8_00315 [Candidatus Dependentiae bacterium]
MILRRTRLVILICITVHGLHAQLCTLHTHAEWENLEKRIATSERFGSKLILIGTLMFKKRANEPIILNHLQMQWHGTYIDQLSASLYHKKNNLRFIPLEDNLICDGIWNKHKQRITFKFNKPYSLSAHTQFYIVLSIPSELENTMKLGSFTIEKNSMPDLIQCSIPDKACILQMAQGSTAPNLASIGK